MSNNQRLPIVLAHGIARFDILLQLQRQKFHLPDTALGDQTQYFKGIKSHLEAHGFEVFHPNQNFAGPLEFRSAQLRDRVDEILSHTGVNKVHIIAHSMGGLDARHMIVDLGMADQVASLTTIGTPHLGTVLADHVLNSGGVFLIDVLSRVIDLNGFEDLTITACEQFNRRAEEQEASNSVFYQTYSSAEDRNAVFTPLIPSWDLIRDHEGRNDGLVPFRSQQWTRELIASDGRRKPVAQIDFPVPADHLNQVGWWDPQEAVTPSLSSLLNLFKVARDAKDYEGKIKDIYLDIARNL